MRLSFGSPGSVQLSGVKQDPGYSAGRILVSVKMFSPFS